jgi:hypothetical protein
MVAVAERPDPSPVIVTVMFDAFEYANNELRKVLGREHVDIEIPDELTDDLNQWQDYIVVDAAIKCLQKEESDVSVLAATKMALINRINNAASNRDAGTPETVSAVRNRETDLDWIFRR